MLWRKGLTLGVISILAGGQAATAAGETAEPTLTVHRGKYRETLLLTGELHAQKRTDLIVPRVPNWRTTIQFMPEDGSAVVAGERVLELDNQNFLTEREEGKLEVLSALSSLVRARAESRAFLAERRYEVDKAALELDKATIEVEVPAELLSQRDHQDRVLAKSRAVTELTKAQESHHSEQTAAAADEANLQLDLETARREFASAERGLETLNFTAPRDGTILVADHPWEKRKFKVGDMVFVGWTVLHLPDSKDMGVRAWLSDVDDGRLEVGMPAEFVLDAHSDRIYTGRVAAISLLADTLESNSLRRGFRARFELDETDVERMRPGMSVKVVVETFVRDDAQLVPRAAIDFRHDPPQIVATDGQPRELSIERCNALVCLLSAEIPDGIALLAPGSKERS